MRETVAVLFFVAQKTIIRLRLIYLIPLRRNIKMKKLGILFFAALLVVAFTMPAGALETSIGGYWRTRAVSFNNYSGEDQTEAYDFQRVDTRTRLYITAVINDNLKFVNKFEMDAVWGDQGYGDIGADGKGLFEIKNTYADFNIGSVNSKVGVQSACLARGFLFCDDFAGAKITFNGEGFSVPFYWIKPYEGGFGKDANDGDVDYYVLDPTFTVGDKVTVNPFVMWATSDNLSAWNPGVHVPMGNGMYVSDGDDLFISNFGIASDADLYYLGVNLDADLGAASVWFTGIYETGSIDFVADDSVDISAYLFALGASGNVGAASVRTQFFYASGQDLTDEDNEDFNAFYVPSQNMWTGQSYYWAEIMGYGTFDQIVSNGSPGDKVSNVMAANLGATFKPMDKLSVALDLWWAKLVEDDFTGESDLGTEVDLTISYELVEGLNLDVVGAYLFAGDRTTADNNGDQYADDANPYELGAMLSLSF